MKKCILNVFLFVLSVILWTGCVEADTFSVQHNEYVIHSIPKCGTHFIQTVAKLLTDKEIITHPVDEAYLERAREENAVLRTHSAYRSREIDLLKAQRIKVISMVRDPRDALISFVFYMRQLGETGLGTKRDFFQVSPDFDALSLNEQITLAITGSEEMQSYLDYYRQRMGWALDPYCHVMRFEDLVGQEGGGSDLLQREAVVNMANYLHLELTPEHLDYVLENMYNKRPDQVIKDKVFTRGATGNWKTFFTLKHRELFKRKFNRALVKLGYEKNSKW